MLMLVYRIPPTRLERLLRVRINMRVFGKFIGTGHLALPYITQDGYETDIDDRSDSSEFSTTGTLTPPLTCE